MTTLLTGSNAPNPSLPEPEAKSSAWMSKGFLTFEQQKFIFKPTTEGDIKVEVIVRGFWDRVFGRDGETVSVDSTANSSVQVYESSQILLKRCKKLAIDPLTYANQIIEKIKTSTSDPTLMESNVIATFNELRETDKTQKQILATIKEAKAAAFKSKWQELRHERQQNASINGEMPVKVDTLVEEKKSKEDLKDIFLVSEPDEMTFEEGFRAALASSEFIEEDHPILINYCRVYFEANQLINTEENRTHHLDRSQLHQVYTDDLLTLIGKVSNKDEAAVYLQAIQKATDKLNSELVKHKEVVSIRQPILTKIDDFIASEIKEQRDLLEKLKKFYPTTAFEGIENEINLKETALKALKNTYTPSSWQTYLYDLSQPVPDLTIDELKLHEKNVDSVLTKEKQILENDCFGLKKVLENLLNFRKVRKELKAIQEELTTGIEGQAPKLHLVYRLREKLEREEKDLAYALSRAEFSTNGNKLSQAFAKTTKSLQQMLEVVEKDESSLSFLQQLYAVTRNSPEELKLKSSYIETFISDYETAKQKIEKEVAFLQQKLSGTQIVASSLINTLSMPAKIKLDVLELSKMSGSQLVHYKEKMMNALMRVSEQLEPLLTLQEKILAVNEVFQQNLIIAQEQINILMRDKPLQHVHRVRLEKIVLKSNQAVQDFLASHGNSLNSVELMTKFLHMLGHQEAVLLAIQTKIQERDLSPFEQLEIIKKEPQLIKAFMLKSVTTELYQQGIEDVRKAIKATEQAIDLYSADNDKRMSDIEGLPLSEKLRVEEILLAKRNQMNELASHYTYTSLKGYITHKKSIPELTPKELVAWYQTVHHELEHAVIELEETLSLQAINRGLKEYDGLYQETDQTEEGLNQQNPRPIISLQRLNAVIEGEKLKQAEYLGAIGTKTTLTGYPIFLEQSKKRIQSEIAEIRKLRLEDQLKGISVDSNDYLPVFNALLQEKNQELTHYIQELESVKTDIINQTHTKLMDNLATPLLKQIDEIIIKLNPLLTHATTGIFFKEKAVQELNKAEILAYCQTVEKKIAQSEKILVEVGSLKKIKEAMATYEQLKVVVKKKREDLQQARFFHLAARLNTLLNEFIIKIRSEISHKEQLHTIAQDAQTKIQNVQQALELIAVEMSTYHSAAEFEKVIGDYVNQLEDFEKIYGSVASEQEDFDLLQKSLVDLVKFQENQREKEFVQQIETFERERNSKLMTLRGLNPTFLTPKKAEYVANWDLTQASLVQANNELKQLKDAFEGVSREELTSAVLLTYQQNVNRLTHLMKAEWNKFEKFEKTFYAEIRHYQKIQENEINQ